MSETMMKNIDLAIRQKEKFTINGNENDVIELNTGDMSIISRYAESIPKINQFIEDSISLEFDPENDPEGVNFSTSWNKINQDIKKLQKLVIMTLMIYFL